jgi:hypothetical protein
VIVRSRLVAPLIAVAAALVLAQYARVWVATPQTLARTSDFAGTYAAATLWRDGNAAQMYDSAAQQRVLAATGAPRNHLDIPFENPPLAAVVAAPFSLLDAVLAYRTWSLLQLLCVLAAVVVAMRAAPWPERTPALVRGAIALTAVAGFGTGALWIEGQWDGPLVLGVAAAYWAWRRDRSLVAGLAIGVTAAVTKPHLALGLAAFMLGRRDWRALAGLAGGAATTLVVALLLEGAQPLASFVSLLTVPRYSPSVQMQSAAGLFASWLGDTSLSYRLALAAGLAAFAVAATLGAATRRAPALLEPALSGALALSLLGSPHLLSHDLSLLAPAFVVTAAWITARESAGGRAWPAAAALSWLAVWTVMSLCSQRDLGNGAPAPPGRVTPWALIIAAALCGVLVLQAPARRRVATAPSATAAR